MVTVTSKATGNWSAGGTWDSDPAIPGDNDDVIINGGYTVTLDAADQCKTVTVRGNGVLALNADLTLTDASGCGITIEDDGNMSNNGTAAAPRTIKSASGDSPTNKWFFSIEDVSTATETRTLDFTYLEFIGNKWRLGNDNNYIDFNTGDATEPIVSGVTPPGPLPRLTEHSCEGRDEGRVYRRGSDARVITISGVCQLDTFLFQQLKDMEDADLKISLFTRYYHFPVCRLEDASPGSSVGIHVGFSITVREDV